jgi:flagellar hook assembly protein FlgD
MGLITWIAIAVIVLVVIGLGAGVFFSGLIRGAEIIGNNPAVQNVTQEAKEFLNGNLQESSSSSSSVLVITTNEARYRIGEPVTITVKNIGEETLTFPNSAAGLKIQNMNMGQIYNVAAAQVMTELGPGASRMITWNQEDDNGNNVPTGDYTATVQTTSSSSSAQSTSSQVSFEITE